MPLHGGMGQAARRPGRACGGGGGKRRALSASARAALLPLCSGRQGRRMIRSWPRAPAAAPVRAAPPAERQKQGQRGRDGEGGGGGGERRPQTVPLIQPPADALPPMNELASETLKHI